MGILAVWQIWKFILAWQELRGALFGMERESAQNRLNQASTILVLLVVIAVAEFMLVTFVVPSYPGALPLPTPTLNLLATATTTLPSVIPSVEQTATLTPSGLDTTAEIGGCIPGQVFLTSPQSDSEVSGEVPLIGTADIPNFGFYKYEVSSPGDALWLPLQVGEQIVREGELGVWNTSNLTPGVYLIRLVVTDNQGNALAPCEIQVRVVAPQP